MLGNTGMGSPLLNQHLNFQLISSFIAIHIHVYIFMCVCICIYIYIIYMFIYILRKKHDYNIILNIYEWRITSKLFQVVQTKVVVRLLPQNDQKRQGTPRPITLPLEIFSMGWSSTSGRPTLWDCCWTGLLGRRVRMSWQKKGMTLGCVLYIGDTWGRVKTLTPYPWSEH